MGIEKLVKIPIRDIYRKEAKDFTQWLENNIDSLNEQAGFSLSSAKREQDAGDFSIDLVAEDENGDSVIIENQLEKTDHDHLGKIITYLTNIEAKTAIWICGQPRHEHIKAINWLNEAAKDKSFYLLKVEGIRLGGNESPLFSVICRPSQEAREIGEKKEEFAERFVKRFEFWKQLLVKSKAMTNLHANISPSKYSWVGTGSGIRGVTYNYVITYNWGASELYIDRGKESEEENKRIFDFLYARKDEIEKNFGGQLDWERLDDRRASRIRVKFDGIGLDSKGEEREKLQDKMIDAMIRLERALKKHIQNINAKTN